DLSPRDHRPDGQPGSVESPPLWPIRLSARQSQTLAVPRAVPACDCPNDQYLLEPRAPLWGYFLDAGRLLCRRVRRRNHHSAPAKPCRPHRLLLHDGAVDYAESLGEIRPGPATSDVGAVEAPRDRASRATIVRVATTCDEMTTSQDSRRSERRHCETHVGILHVHSNLSYDGQNTLAEIALLAKSRSYQFVAMSEHSDTFDPQKMAYLVDECRRLSDASFLMIPGLEFTCDNRLHLLALGIERYTDIRNPALVARFVSAQGGLAILSHPSRYRYQVPSGLETLLDGIEVWNAGYDGRFIPNDRSIRLWDSLRVRNKSLRAFGSQDLHAIGDHRHVRVSVRCDQVTRSAILKGLKNGDFIISNSYVRLRSNSSPGWLMLNVIGAGHRAYLTARAIRDRVARGFQH